MVNPWSPPACIGVTTSTPNVPTNASATIVPRHNQASLYARAHSLSINASITKNDGLPVSTVVSDGFTFTSPSIYAQFHGIGAGDWCGATTIQQTMLSFTPGELSTIAGPLYSGISAGHGRPDLQTKAFNVADLPCPPQSVMEQNWYKPEPGEPYRPLIAIPGKVRAIDPWFSSCTDLWFDAVDPPRALGTEGALAAPTAFNGPEAKAPGSVLVNPTTSVHAPAPTTPPVPGSVVQPGPTPTGFPDSAPSQTPAVVDSSAQSNDNNAQGHENQPTSPGASQQDENHGGSAGNNGDGNLTPDPQSPASNGPGLPSLPSFDPQNVAPDQMSQIEGALDTNSPAPAQPTNTPLQEGGSVSPGSNNQAGSPQALSAAPTSVQVAGHAVVINPSGVNVDGSQINPGDSPARVSGGVAINQGNNIVVGSQIEHIDTPPVPSATNLAGHVVQPLSTGVLVDNNLVTPGGSPVTVSGTAVSLDGSGHLSLGGTMYHVPSATPAPTSRLSNGAIAVPIPNGVSVLGTTLTAGASAIMISGTAMSLDASNNLIFDGTAHAISTPVGSSWNPGSITTVNGQTFTELSNGVCISGTTLAPGAPPITVSGTSMSLADHALIVGKTTVPVILPTEQPLTTTVGGQIITAAPSAINIAGTTLLPGASAMTISGTEISLNTAGGLVVGSKTIPLPTSPSGLGSLIMGGFGPSTTGSASTSNVPVSSPAGATNTSAQSFKGGSGSVKPGLRVRWMVTTLAVVVAALHM